jgi:stage V sporulation protein S
MADGHSLQPFVFDQVDQALHSLEPSVQDRGGRAGRGGGGRTPRGPGQHAARRAADDSAKPGSDFWDRIMRPGGQGRNVTKVGGGSNPRDVASQIAAQARAAVDCPTLQCIGPSATNQAIKAVAIARTYLAKSDASGQSAHPDVILYPEFIKLDSSQVDEGTALSALQLTLCKRVRRTSVDKEGRSLKVSSSTEAKSLAGAIASCTREGSRVELTGIGAGSVNQAIKAIAIARQYVEEEAIDLCCRPEFVEIEEGGLGQGEGPAHGQGGSTSALRIIVLVEQT